MKRSLVNQESISVDTRQIPERYLIYLLFKALKNTTLKHKILLEFYSNKSSTNWFLREFNFQGHPANTKE